MAFQGDCLLCRCPSRFQTMFLSICAVTLLVWLFLYALTDVEVKGSSQSVESWKISDILQRVVSRVQAAVSLPQKQRKRKLVLLWTDYFGKIDWLPSTESLQCPVTECDVISDRSLLLNSSAVILHWRNTDVHNLPGCVPSDDIRCPLWVLFNKEAPRHTPRYILESLQNNVHWTATYRRDSDLFAPYGKVEPRKELNYENPDFDGKQQLVCWLVSNCNTFSKRESFVANLSDHIEVDIYGNCGDLKCPYKLVKECYQWLSKRCKFYLSLENSICKDYITEKLFYALFSGMVPIVFGNSSNYHFLPPDSYISADNFSSLKDLAEYLVTVGKDKDLYLSYFTWKKNYEVIDYAYKWLCQLCEKLHDESHVVIPSANSYKDLTSWWFDQSGCIT